MFLIIELRGTMPFNSVTLPRVTETQFTSYLKSSNLSGGVFLFHGTSDHNRLVSMDLFAKYYLCVGTKDPTCPCISCRVFDDNHPDLFRMSLSAAGNLLVDTVRDAIEFLGEHSTLADRRCLLIPEADKLTEAAEGGLLKVLEEEMEGMLVILACRDKRSIPKTILSRSKTFFTGDANRDSYFNSLSRLGMRPKKAEEFSKLSPSLSFDPVRYDSVIEEAHKITPYLFTYIMSGDTSKALSKFSEYASKSKDDGLTILAEVLIATAVDFQKAKFRAPSKYSMPSRTEWYAANQEAHKEVLLENFVSNFSKVLSVEKRNLRAMLIWAIGLVSMVCKAELEKGKKERESA